MRETFYWIGATFAVLSVLCVPMAMQRDARLRREGKASASDDEHGPLIIGLGAAGLVTWAFTLLVGGLWLLRTIIEHTPPSAYLWALLAFALLAGGRLGLTWRARRRA